MITPKATRETTIIDPANVVEGDPPPEFQPAPPGSIPPAYFTFNEDNQPFTEAPNFGPVAIEPVE